MIRKFVFLASISILAVLFNSCVEPEDPVVTDEEEVITGLYFFLYPDGGGGPLRFKFDDPDGDGGEPPTIQNKTLERNTNYSGVIKLWNGSVDPPEEVTPEVRAENSSHQVFYQTDVEGLTIGYTDQDADGKPVGLNTRVSTKEKAAGTLTVVLRHEPNKGAEGVSSGNIENAGGETDIEVTFDVNVK